MSESMCVCMYMHACLYVYMYVICINVCIYVHMCVCICTLLLIVIYSDTNNIILSNKMFMCCLISQTIMAAFAYNYYYAILKYNYCMPVESAILYCSNYFYYVLDKKIT